MQILYKSLNILDQIIYLSIFPSINKSFSKLNLNQITTTKWSSKQIFFYLNVFVCLILKSWEKFNIRKYLSSPILIESAGFIFLLIKMFRKIDFSNKKICLDFIYLLYKYQFFKKKFWFKFVWTYRIFS